MSNPVTNLTARLVQFRDAVLAALAQLFNNGEQHTTLLTQVRDAVTANEIGEPDLLEELRTYSSQAVSPPDAERPTLGRTLTHIREIQYFFAEAFNIVYNQLTTEEESEVLVPSFRDRILDLSNVMAQVRTNTANSNDNLQTISSTLFGIESALQQMIPLLEAIRDCTCDDNPVEQMPFPEGECALFGERWRAFQPFSIIGGTPEDSVADLYGYNLSTSGEPSDVMVHDDAFGITWFTVDHEEDRQVCIARNLPEGYPLGDFRLNYMDVVGQDFPSVTGNFTFDTLTFSGNPGSVLYTLTGVDTEPQLVRRWYHLSITTDANIANLDHALWINWGALG